MSDYISRQDAQKCQRVAQKRRYTFGNNEFSLEDAYHDCKLVFDGITDDNSFQEADTGLVLYYANEIIYALHEALRGNDTNVPSNNLIDRQAAIDEIEYELEMINLALDSITLDFNARERLRQRKGEAREILNSIQQLPSAQPEDKCSECDAWNKYKNYPQEQRWISATISPKVSGKYLVTHGGNYNLSLDAYTTMEDAVRIFDEGYEDYIGWQSQNVIAWMPLPEPYREEGEQNETN